MSAVDTETEDIILSNLKKRQTTSIVISHRISSLRNASRIINIENGSITEQGTHSELIELNGMYSVARNQQMSEDTQKKVDSEVKKLVNSKIS